MSARSELRVIGRQAATVLVGQLAVMAFGVTDTLVAGRYSSEALAALSVGSAIFISVYVSLLGTVGALLPVYAELHGAGRPAEVGRAFRQAIYLGAVLVLLGAVLMASSAPLLRWADVPEPLREPVGDYLAVLAVGLLPALAFRMIASLNQALGQPRPVTLMQLGSLLLKVPLSVWFVFGGAGLPPLGVVGCAWATLIANCAMLALALWWLRTRPMYQPYQIWRRFERPDGPRLRGFIRLGVPAGLATMVEVTSFTLMALLIAPLGTLASAGHQVAASVVGMLYMMPLATGLAASARVSFWLGAGDAVRAREALRAALTLSAALASLSALGVALLARPLAQVYAAPPDVALLAASLLLWVAPYHLADALQAVCMFLLRSYRVSVRPFIVYTLVLWGGGLGGGYWLCHQGLAGLAPVRAPQAFWIAAVLSVALVAVLFSVMLWRVAHRHRPLPARATPGSPER